MIFDGLALFIFFGHRLNLIKAGAMNVIPRKRNRNKVIPFTSEHTFFVFVWFVNVFVRFNSYLAKCEEIRKGLLFIKIDDIIIITSNLQTKKKR